MDEKYCNDCSYFRWIEDYYDNGTYVEYFYYDEDHGDVHGYHQPACEHYCKE